MKFGQGLSITASRRLSHGLLYLFMAFACYVMLLPLFWMLSASFKTDLEMFRFPIQWIPQPFLIENYFRAWETINFGRLMSNTIFISVMVTGFQIITCTLAGYAFSKLKFKGRDAIFIAYLATLMVPFQVVMIPQFTIIRMIGLIDSHWSIILIQAFSPFGVFLMRQFFLGIPYDLSEAARIDGLGEFGTYLKIILPLSKPAIATLIIFTSIFTWNDFLTPLIYINTRANFTIQLGLRTLFAENATDFGAVMAGATMSIIPMLAVFVLLQRFFVQGIAMGGIKG